MSEVTAEEIKIIVNEQEAFYLTEALFAYEQRHIENNMKPYLPGLLLQLQTVCRLAFDKKVTAKCRECL